MTNLFSRKIRKPNNDVKGYYEDCGTSCSINCDTSCQRECATSCISDCYGTCKGTCIKLIFF